MNTHHTADIVRYRTLNTCQLREAFLLDELFVADEAQLFYTDQDRAIVGGCMPGAEPIALPAGEALRADFFCQRRELGVINIGDAGHIEVDGVGYDLARGECLYVGRGSKVVRFSSKDAQRPAAFYLLSYPAHTAYPTTKATPADANVLELGTSEDSNRRTLYQFIHENGIRSCQLVMGYTAMHEGSVWNTMPSHLHARRTEVYCYFDVPDGHQVAHFMGVPEETRSLWVKNRQAVISPSWSIHSGCGTNAYKFIWGMGGENQRFDDMDGLQIENLR